MTFAAHIGVSVALRERLFKITIFPLITKVKVYQPTFWEHHSMELLFVGSPVAGYDLKTVILLYTYEG